MSEFDVSCTFGPRYILHCRSEREEKWSRSQVEATLHPVQTQGTATAAPSVEVGRDKAAATRAASIAANGGPSGCVNDYQVSTIINKPC